MYKQDEVLGFFNTYLKKATKGINIDGFSDVVIKAGGWETKLMSVNKAVEDYKNRPGNKQLFIEIIMQIALAEEYLARKHKDMNARQLSLQEAINYVKDVARKQPIFGLDVVGFPNADAVPNPDLNKGRNKGKEKDNTTRPKKEKGAEEAVYIYDRDEVIAFANALLSDTNVSELATTKFPQPKTFDIALRDLSIAKRNLEKSERHLNSHDLHYFIARLKAAEVALIKYDNAKQTLIAIKVKDPKKSEEQLKKLSEQIANYQKKLTTYIEYAKEMLADEKALAIYKDMPVPQRMSVSKDSGKREENRKDMGRFAQFIEGVKLARQAGQKGVEAAHHAKQAIELGAEATKKAKDAAAVLRGKQFPENADKMAKQSLRDNHDIVTLPPAISQVIAELKTRQEKLAANENLRTAIRRDNFEPQGQEKARILNDFISKIKDCKGDLELIQACIAELRKPSGETNQSDYAKLNVARGLITQGLQFFSSWTTPTASLVDKLEARVEEALLANENSPGNKG